MLRELLKKVVEGKNLTFEESREAVIRLMSGEESPELVAGFLVALRMKGETPEEIAGFAQGMREKGIHPDIGNIPAIDTCGTGGDGLHTFNASTCSAIVVSAMGVPVAKHGNRGISSKTGSADILEKLKIPINIPPEKVKDEITRKNFVFLFAPLYHPAMREVAPIRKALGIRTIFNLLGPLTNPAGVKRQVIGVFSPEFARKIAEAITILGSEKAFVVCGETESGYIDEVSPCGETLVIQVENRKMEEMKITPEELGIKRRWKLEDIRQREKDDEYVMDFENVLSGKGKKSLVEFVSLNSAFALYVAGIVNSPERGFEKSMDFIESGKAREHLEKLRNS